MLALVLTAGDSGLAMETIVLGKAHADEGGSGLIKGLITCGVALALTACATRPDGGSAFLDTLFGAAGPTPGPAYAAPLPQGNPTYTCFTQPAPYGGGGTTTCLQQPSTAVSPPLGVAPGVTCFTQPGPYSGGAVTTCIPH